MITRRVGKGISGRELENPIRRGDKIINQGFVYNVVADYTTTGAEDYILIDSDADDVDVTLSIARRAERQMPSIR
jgi:hypothetical protein